MMEKMRLKKMVFFAFFLQVASGPKQKGNSRHWRVQTNGCHVRGVDGDRASPTQRTASRAPVMILSSLHHRKEHPATGVPPKHTSAHLDGPLRRDTATYSPQSSSVTLENALTCENRVWHLTEASMRAQGLRRFSHLKWCEWGLYLLLSLRGVFHLRAQFSRFTPPAP